MAPKKTGIKVARHLFPQELLAGSRMVKASECDFELRFSVPVDKKRSFWRCSSQPIAWLVLRKLTLKQRKPHWQNIRHTKILQRKINTTRMWADAQRDSRPAEYRWRPLLNAVDQIAKIFAPGKTPLGTHALPKCIYSVPAQETAKHRANFG